MDTGSIIGIIGILITTVIAIYAINDARRQVRKQIELERKRVYTRVRNQLVWQFIEPIQDVHKPEIAEGLEEFALISQTLNPAHTPELTKNAVENETLLFAKKLVDGGYGRFKPGFNEQKIKETIRRWQNSINAERVSRILGRSE